MPSCAGCAFPLDTPQSQFLTWQSLHSIWNTDIVSWRTFRVAQSGWGWKKSGQKPKRDVQLDRRGFHECALSKNKVIGISRFSRASCRSKLHTLVAMRYVSWGSVISSCVMAHNAQDLKPLSSTWSLNEDASH